MSCMGGWCHLRDRCKHYEPAGIPVERLCEAKDDDAFEPIVFVRPVGSWERRSRGLAPAQWHGVIA